uniref:RNA-directed DNA polymerase n=1 Tax=Oryctolagus cuniculus TaxID=9986 RepID=A0A5F9DJY2_RABIT
MTTSLCIPMKYKLSTLRECCPDIYRRFQHCQASVIRDGHHTVINTLFSSPQLVGLAAVALALQSTLDLAVNIHTDSKYVFLSVPQLETCSFFPESSAASPLFSRICVIIRQRTCPFFIGHTRAHSNLPGPLVEGNCLADSALRIYSIETATKDHALHHLNAHTLRLKHKITREQARQIVKSCSICSILLPVPYYGINPRGLFPNQLWQLDITHFMEFGKQKYIHVPIDTCSGFIFASLHTGEATKHVIAHCLQAFASLGTPKQIKMDNGPAYTSTSFKTFCSAFFISYVTGIPYNPQGQGIVERAHNTLKQYLNKIKKGEFGISAHSPNKWLSHSLFILNFLTLDKDGRSAAD